MKTWQVTVKIIGLGGTVERKYEVEAKTESVARRKAYELIGNQTGDVVAVKQLGS